MKTSDELRKAAASLQVAANEKQHNAQDLIVTVGKLRQQLADTNKESRECSKQADVLKKQSQTLEEQAGQLKSSSNDIEQQIKQTTELIRMLEKEEKTLLQQKHDIETQATIADSH